MTRLILIRHGETDYNLEKRYCGFGNPPLNSKGIWQAKKLAVRLKGLNVDRVYSSDLDRAYETAKIIFRNNSIEKAKDLREMNFGLFEGLKHEEIIKTHAKLYRNWIDNPLRVKVPSGEGLVELERRVKKRLFLILCQDVGKTIALVSHGGPIKIILCQALKFGLESFWKVEQEIGTLRIIDYPEGVAA